MILNRLRSLLGLAFDDFKLIIRDFRISPIRFSPINTFANGEIPLSFHQQILQSFTNWRKYTILPPTTPLEFRQLYCQLDSYVFCVITDSSQLAKVHCTFANMFGRISTIGESLVEFRQYTSGFSPVANVLLAKVLLAKFR